MADFHVYVPEHTPHDRTVYLTGDGPVLGHWCPRAVTLHRWHDGTHRAKIAAPVGSRFLVTLGSWRSVECDRESRELPSRVVNFTNGVLEADVAGWDRNSVRYHLEFPSRFLPRSRTINVYVPPGYDLEPERRFPVFYMHDGQNLFDAATSTFVSASAWVRRFVGYAVSRCETPSVRRAASPTGARVTPDPDTTISRQPSRSGNARSS